MKIAEFDYELPPQLIAQSPAAVRDQSRLMVVERATGRIEHRGFRELPDILTPDDFLVLNQSRVIKARLLGRRVNGSPMEAFLLRELEDGVWEALLKPGRRIRTGQRVVFSPGELEATVLECPPGAPRRLRFHCQGELGRWLEKLGHVPLPPYIQRDPGPSPEDSDRYQTVYAKTPGSVAAPTAGLHFTPALLSRLPHGFVTLHVGYGTFKPVSVDDVAEHRMDPESYHVDPETAGAIRSRLEAGKRITAVGTTSTRVLEHLAARPGGVAAGEGLTDLFIYPGYRFRAVEALITNFHLPRSTLLLLVSAFAGVALIRECYRLAIARKYRFYSYGDAMLIL